MQKHDAGHTWVLYRALGKANPVQNRIGTDFPAASVSCSVTARKEKGTLPSGSRASARQGGKRGGACWSAEEEGKGYARAWALAWLAGPQVGPRREERKGAGGALGHA